MTHDQYDEWVTCGRIPHLGRGLVDFFWAGHMAFAFWLTAAIIITIWLLWRNR